jgi:hypothetical protein
MGEYIPTKEQRIQEVQQDQTKLTSKLQQQEHTQILLNL